MTPPRPEPRCWVEISRSRLAANYSAVAGTVGPAVTILPVVKADAYRHGAAEVSKVLVKSGARWLAVSSAEEGVALRDAGLSSPRILVMADFLPSSREAILHYGLTPVLHSLAEVRDLEAMAAARRSALAFHLKLDTGMGRLGTRATAGEIAASVGSLRWAMLEGLMTHFASAADDESPQTAEQIERFERIASELESMNVRPAFRHLASTIPVAHHHRHCWASMVRPGHAIYGYASPLRSGAPGKIDVHPALTWRARLLLIKDLPAGATVGYGATCHVDRPTRIGVVAAGYADGIPHRASNQGRVIAGGKLVPILGAVSMDVLTVDLTDAPWMKPGDAVTLLGREGDASWDAHQIAKTAGTISYRVLCGISARVARRYID